MLRKNLHIFRLESLDQFNRLIDRFPLLAFPLSTLHTPPFQWWGRGSPSSPRTSLQPLAERVIPDVLRAISRYLTVALCSPPRCIGFTTRPALALMECLRMYEELLRPRGCIAEPARYLTPRDARLNPLVGAALAAGQLDLDMELDSGKIKELVWC